ncbi:hypothetical protein LCGC14_0792870, partial [marine sediment metagenome]
LQKCHKVVQIDTPQCLNVAVAGSIVMFDRQGKQRKIGKGKHDDSKSSSSETIKLGQTSASAPPISPASRKGKRFHDKALRAWHHSRTGKTKKLKAFSIKLRKALDSGKAKFMDTPGKNIYIYHLR